MAGIARNASIRESGSSVSMVPIRPSPKPNPVSIGSASAIVRIKPVTSWRGRARSANRIAAAP
jgi:hypothetical protein